MSRKTVHVIFHAHLDPIWLWPWQAGVDEALATTRSACDRLDAHPDLCYSQGEAWVYHQVETLDPELFARVRKHVEAGRWELLGGWWTQPDCNFPSEIGLQRQIKMGREYFESRFGAFPNIAFNADSFGHNASLPRIMRENGQDHYIFMRPQEHEMALPARAFRWRGYADGPEVTTFRIYKSYCPGEITADFLRGCFTELPEGLLHTACFCGVGDHGGGPTEELIAQVEAVRAEVADEFDVRFSTAREFFACVDESKDVLPLVVGELQFHAIGCYTVHREGKVALRDATERLRQLEVALAGEKEWPAGTEESLRYHWRNVVFHQFHDTLGGTCLPSAYRHIRNQLGAAEAFGEETLCNILRKKLLTVAGGAHRMVLLNASDEVWDGWYEVEPWLDQKGWQDVWSIVDESGQPVKFQRIKREACCGRDCRMAIRLTVQPGELCVLTVNTQEGGKRLFPDGDTVGLTGDAHCFGNLCGAAVAVYPPEMVVGNWDLALPDVLLYPDNSDTWSHSIDRYPDKDEELPVWSRPVMTEDGPFLREITQKGRIGNSDLLRKFRIYAEESYVEMRLRVDWQEKHKILKLMMPYSGYGETRIDGIPGSGLERKQDGAERPIQNWTMLPLTEDEALCIVCPDVFAMDATPDRARLTLLRSSQMAHHDPTPAGRVDARFSDRGEHEFRFIFKAGNCTPEELDRMAKGILRQPVYADYTNFSGR